MFLGSGKKSDADLLNSDTGITERKIDLHRGKRPGGRFRIPGVDTEVLLRVLAAAGLLVFFALLQTTIFARFRPFGVVPDLMLPLVIAVDMTEGERFGAVFGVIAAFVIESLGGAAVSLLPLLYLPAGIFAGLLTKEFFRDSFAVRLLFTAAGCLLRMAFTLVTLKLTVRDFSLGPALAKIALPEFSSTSVFAFLPHLAAKAAMRVFHKPREEKVE